MSSYPNRTPVRESIAALLTTALSGVATVENYLVVDPADRAPLVYVTSANIAPDPDEPQGGRSALAGFEVVVMVAYAQGTTWTARDCEDLSDSICKTIYDTVRGNYTTALWSDLFVSESSRPSLETVGGTTYRVESIPVVARATGD